jgi:hypothetical protein
MPATRLKSLIPAFPALAAAIILFLVGTYRTDLTCDRAANSCTWRDGLFGGDPTTFPISDVREVKYEGGRGKHGGDGQVLIVLANGKEESFGKADDDVAKATTEEARAFFAGTGASYHWGTSPRTWMFVAAAGMLLASLSLFVTAFRKPPTTEASRKQRNNEIAVLAMGIVTLTVISTIITACVT